MANQKISALTASTTPLAGTEVLPIVQGGATKQVSVANLTAGRAVGASTVQASTGFGVGVTPTFPLQIQQNGTATGLGITTNAKILDSSANKGFQIGYSDSAQKAVFLSNTTSATSAIGFWAYDAGGSGWAERLEISGPGNITFNTGNLIQGTAAKGINFTANTPAAGMTSQLLNWYEDGAYTATMSPTTSGSITLAGTHNTLKYTRIGRQVTVVGMLMVDSVSSPVGAININLPFAAAFGNSSNAAASLFVNGSNGPQSADFIGFVGAGTSTLQIYLGDGNFVQSDSANAMQANTQVTISATYFV